MNEHRPHDGITVDPEYARAYKHYATGGQPPDHAAELAYAWVQNLHSRPPAPVRATNHVAHGLGMAFMFVIGGPIALCVGIGGSESSTVALPLVVGGWLFLLICQAAIWIGASRA